VEASAAAAGRGIADIVRRIGRAGKATSRPAQRSIGAAAAGQAHELWRRSFLALTLLASTAASALAGVNCKFNGCDIIVCDSLADLQYSASGKRERERNDNLSMLRLLTLQASKGDTQSVELKTVDVTQPGDYPLSWAPGWRSNVDAHGEHGHVTGGVFHIRRFEVNGTEGRAAVTVEFATAKIQGCAASTCRCRP
jgi:hypothetical protein